MGFISTLFGGKTKTEKTQEAQINNMLLPLLQSQADMGKQAYTLGTGSLADFKDTIKGPEDFWKTILSGDSDAIAKLLGPETSAIETAYGNQAKSNAEFNPRGGGEVAQNTALQLQKLGTLGDMPLKLRTEAADSLSSIASLFANLGLGEIGAGTGAGGSAIGGLLNKNQQNQDSYRFRSQQLSQTMSSIGQMLAMI